MAFNTKRLMSITVMLALSVPQTAQAAPASPSNAPAPMPCFDPLVFTPDVVSQTRTDIPRLLAPKTARLDELKAVLHKQLAGVVDFRKDRIYKRLEMTDRLVRIILSNTRSKDSDSILFSKRLLADLDRLLAYFAEESAYLEPTSQARQEQLFSLHDFGATGDAVANDQLAFDKALEAIEKLKGAPARLFLPKGIYALNTLSMVGLRNLTVEGESADTELRFQQDDTSGVTLTDCDNVLLRNLTLRYQNPTFAEGEITRLVVAEKAFIYNPVPNTVLPDATLFSGRRLTQLNTSDGNLVTSRFFTFAAPVAQPDGTYKIPVTEGDFSVLARKQRIILRQRKDVAAIYIKNSRFCTAQDVTIYNSWGFGLVSLGSSASSFVSCRILPDEGKTYSVNADGLHAPNNDIGAYLSECTFVAMGDDPYNSYNKGNHLSSIDENRLIKAHGNRPGDALSLISVSTGQVLGEINVTSVKPTGWRNEAQHEITFEGIASPNLRSHDNLSTRPFTKEELGNIYLSKKAYPEPDQVFNYQRSGLASVITGCRFANNRNCGPIIQTNSFLLEDSVIENMESHAIKIGAFTTWREGPPPINVLVRGNRFVNSGRIRTEFVVQAGGLSPGRHIRSVTFENNEVSNSKSHAFSLECAEGIELIGNKIINPKGKAFEIGNAGRVSLINNQVNGNPAGWDDIKQSKPSGLITIDGSPREQ